MLNENDLKKMIQDVIKDILKEQVGTISSSKDNEVVEEEKKSEVCTVIEDDYVDDITEIPIKEQILVPEPADLEGYMKMKQYCPARLGIWRAGPRHKTLSTLRFWADHAAAQGAVFSYVNEDFVDELVEKYNVIKTETISKDKSEFLTNPPTGRQFSEEQKEIIKKNTKLNAKVQIVIGDGLSSAAITANIKDVLPAVEQGLKEYDLDFGKHVFVKHCRVGAMDIVGEVTGADVVVLLVGERPGLATSESMSAYIVYKPTVGMQESRRTVISNIHKGGTPAVEAGARIAELVKTMVEKKVSGQDLKNL